MILSICRIQLQRSTLVCHFMPGQHSFRLLRHLPDTKQLLKKTVRQTDAKQVLSEEVIAELNKRLYLIAETIGTQQMVEITYFVPDTKKDGGAYITCSGCVKKIDKYKHTVVMTDQTIIPIEQISNIEGEMFEE